ncbi:agmatinase [Candidatus Marinamargulisbacteria bacterium SCGC AAA071-K20]|nr:agmatinase [Candidatus Marinamargulisbacteria bacterium SCGC AAA071-K20]
MANSFNPNLTTVLNGNIFGLPHTQEDAKVIILPVPWDATASYRDGTANNTQNIIKASTQIDLMTFSTPEILDEGIAIQAPDSKWVEKNKSTRKKAKDVIDALERGDDLKTNNKILKSIEEVNQSSEELNEWVYSTTKELINSDKLVVLLGGDHSSSYGYIKALSEIEEFAILQIDAHMDLRVSYQGFKHSHASIMTNALKLKQVSRLVQVGTRDYSDSEYEVEQASKGRIKTFYDQDIKAHKFMGKSWQAYVKKIINALPDNVYISCDIDGLNPSLCPNTGTPVPGGLEFDELLYLFDNLIGSNRKIIGCDLVEVGTSPTLWDENVASRILFQLACYLLESHLN